MRVVEHRHRRPREWWILHLLEILKIQLDVVPSARGAPTLSRGTGLFLLCEIIMGTPGTEGDREKGTNTLTPFSPLIAAAHRYSSSKALGNHMWNKENRLHDM